ncbi:uncharacterized protein LOC133834012 [Humulus lupulus]|uniref:uncharacterized protein LOC133834012 n=1 Tax=Humulus lupulus TaxID=3486 RepID=UPI002B402744|nr:uncharacterized protein LOC133834012 [Humulus lupulus]
MAAPAPTVRIPVNTQALEKIPEAFRGTIYETASYTVDHYYNSTLRDLQEIETRIPKNVMESSMGMTFTVVLALHRSISWSRARLEEIKGEHHATLAALASAQQQEQDEKAARATAQAELEACRSKLLVAESTKVALVTAKVELE